jgi:outer membrane protein assembly factor BamB
MRKAGTGLVVAAVAFTFSLIPVAGRSADWPQWRGPNRDGVIRGVSVPKKWPRTLKEEWKVTGGEGIASPVVQGNKVFVFTRQKNNKEVVLCLDLHSGKEKWRSTPDAAAYKRGIGEGNGSIGPRSTPVVAGGKVFALGITGILSCLDAATGKLLWRKDPRQYPAYGACASPLVADGLVVVHGGEQNKGNVTAFDVKSGELKWTYTDGSSPGYGSPILVDRAGERQVVTCTSWDLLGLSLRTGKKLWAMHLDGGGDNCVTPVQYKDLLICAGGNARPRAIRLEKDARSGLTAREVWKGDGPTLYLNSPVLAGDWLFGLSNQQQLFCLDARTGKTLWRSDRRQDSYAAILNAGSVWLALTSRQLLVVKHSGKAYEPIAQYPVSDPPASAHPIFLGNRILIKGHSTLASFRIEQDRER